MAQQRSTVALASSADAELGDLSAPLGATLNAAQVDAVVRRALDLDASPKALERLVTPGDWVVVKPNIVTSPTHECSYWHGGTPHPGQVTDLRVVQSLVAYLLERCRPGRITIAEGGAEWRRSHDPDKEDGWTVSFPDFDGLSYAGMVAGFARRHPGIVDIVDLNEDDIRFLPVPDPHGTGIGALQYVGQQMRSPERFGRGAYVPGTGTLRQGYHIPATALDCDIFISVPPLKTHSCATTLAIKNYIGILPSHPSGVVNKGDVHDGDFQRGFVDLFSYHPADYSLLEGFWGTEGNGPQWGDNIQHNVVVASADPVAADAVGSELMGFNATDIDYLHYAAAKGFGTFDLGRLDLVGAPMECLRRPFRTAAGRKNVPFTARGNRLWLVRAESDGQPQRLESEERYIDLDRFFGGRTVSAATASVTVHATGQVTGHLWAGADGRLRVELNGEVLVDRPRPAAHRLGEHRVPVRLRAGDNELRVHVERGPSGMGFTAILCDGQGYGLRGIDYCAIP